MDLFENIIEETKKFSLQKTSATHINIPAGKEPVWEVAGRNDIVLGNDVGIELGHPQDASTSFLLWTNKKDLVTDGNITVIGPDIGETQDKRLPFGKVVLISGQGFSAENAWDRYRELEPVRFDLSLKGFMLRAVSQYMREWSRISKRALLKGFSFSVLAGSLMRAYRQLDYVTGVEILFVTRNTNDVLELGQIGEKGARIIQAMRKMEEEMAFDCSVCDYQDVCSDAGQLSAMRKKLVEKRQSKTLCQ